MGYSPDKMLQARLISYPDAHRYRLGANYDALPVNRPQCPVHTYQRDGAMRFDGNSGSAPNYEPNSFNGPVENSSYRERPRAISGSVPVDRHDHRQDDDYYTQPGNLFRLMKPDERDRLIGNIVASMKVCRLLSRDGRSWHFKKADPAYGAGVAQMAHTFQLDSWCPMEYRRVVQTVVETPTYLAIANKLFSEEERADVVALVTADPECGDLIRGTGGFRKVRVARKGMGKSGGARVVYIWSNEDFRFFLLRFFRRMRKKTCR
jgi:hypothetical protein